MGNRPPLAELAELAAVIDVLRISTYTVAAPDHLHGTLKIKCKWADDIQVSHERALASCSIRLHGE